MTIERAIISRAQPFVFAAKAKALIRDELMKGCRPEMSHLPVALEPYFQPIETNASLLGLQSQPSWILDAPIYADDLVRMRIWISPKQDFDWRRSELFLKQLQNAAHRVGFEISGNDRGIVIGLLCHPTDAPILTAAFQGEFEKCELTVDGTPWTSRLTESQWSDLVLSDFYPAPPYSHLLTRPDELTVSSLEPLIVAISRIPAPALGLYQILFQAVSPDHNWHRNIQVLLDFEYALKLQDGFSAAQRYAQQGPSGDLKQMAWEVENKAHNDKPLYAAALRLAVIGAGENSQERMLALSTFTGLFQHGGRPLEKVTEQDYLAAFDPMHIGDMFLSGQTHRPGFLVNSWELTGLVHVPPLSIASDRRIVMDELETLPVRSGIMGSGTYIGVCRYAGTAQPVFLPDNLRARSTHIIGRPGSGKTSAQEHMILQDIEQGHGVAVLDPHGDLSERLLCLIPEAHVGRVIYFNPGDPDWIPIWNPLQRIPGQDIGRMADDLVRAIKSFVSSGGWGDRLEHLLRNMIFGLIHLPHSTFLDLSNLLRNSDESKRLCSEIKKHLDNESARQFWEHDYGKYTKDDLGPPRNKLSKLLLAGSVSLMLSQPESRFNFRQIMDEGLIFLVNLSNVGSNVRGILGSFILSLLHLSALSRSSIPIEERKQFHIHCDEAHLIMTDTLEDLIAETRKYKVSLSLAHQFMSQFGNTKIDAFSSVGSTLIFNVDSKDARYLTKDLQGLVEVDDLTSLQIREAIVRIGTDIVRVETSLQMKIPQVHFRDRIISESRRKYCQPVHEVRKWIRQRGDRWITPFRSLVPDFPEPTASKPAEFFYEEF